MIATATSTYCDMDDDFIDLPDDEPTIDIDLPDEPIAKAPAPNEPLPTWIADSVVTDAERYVLGTALSQSRFGEFLDMGLTAAYFTGNEARAVWRAAEKVFAESGEVDDIGTLLQLRRENCPSDTEHFLKALPGDRALVSSEIEILKWAKAEREVHQLLRVAQDSLQDRSGGAIAKTLESMQMQLARIAEQTPQTDAVNYSFAALSDRDFEMPDILIDGIVHRGGKVLLSGPSKAAKTYAMIQLAIAAATGGEWLGFGIKCTNVLVIDLELLRPALFNRIRRVADAMKLPKGWESRLHAWSLRGEKIDLEKLSERIIKYARKHNIGLISIDPIYRIRTGEENSNDDTADFLLQIERIATKSNATVLLAHHFAKGNSAVKNSIDRMSGAGVFARDPDALLSLTEAGSSTVDSPHFVVEAAVREFKPVPPFGIRKDFPLWVRDDDISLDLKGAAGRPSGAGTGQDLVCILENAEAALTAKDFAKEAAEENGIPRSRFYALLRQEIDRGTIAKVKDGRKSLYSIKRFLCPETTETF